ncbi:hypothetical protein, partial [Salmonella enterica]|uniref:hypothetical protein n=1 Tax=Salmonella enterica TaxID=28901 RepID=UPI002EB4B8D1|nr:hypothetical protein [Salmonella enterica subsp. enterica serovar Paratyphi A]
NCAAVSNASRTGDYSVYSVFISEFQAPTSGHSCTRSVAWANFLLLNCAAVSNASRTGDYSVYSVFISEFQAPTSGHS